MAATNRRALGGFGETITDRVLGQRGFAVLGRNVRLMGTECDRIYLRRDTLIFAEVKTLRRPRPHPRGIHAEEVARDRARCWLGGPQCQRQQRAIAAWCLRGMDALLLSAPGTRGMESSSCVTSKSLPTLPTLPTLPDGRLIHILVLVTITVQNELPSFVSGADPSFSLEAYDVVHGRLILEVVSPGI